MVRPEGDNIVDRPDSTQSGGGNETPKCKCWLFCTTNVATQALDLRTELAIGLSPQKAEEGLRARQGESYGCHIGWCPT